MQDSYAFDVGDFGKFGLLRHLLSGPGSPPLGVVWYATAVAAKADDGKHVGYLGEKAMAKSLRACDEDLHDAFRHAYPRGRSISALEELGALPRSTTFHKEPVAAGLARTEWFRRAATAVERAGVVFCDPDNGIAGHGSSTERSGSIKHVLLEEIGFLHRRGQSLVVYHHLARQKGGHALDIRRWTGTLREMTGRGDVACARFRRGTSRAFFVVPGDRAPDIASRLAALRGTQWVGQGHFEIVESSIAD